MKSWLLAENQVRDAERRGVLDNLPGKGKPQPDDDLAGLDDVARMEALLRRSTGGGSLELDLKKEVALLRARLAEDDLDDADRAFLKQKLIDKVTQLSIAHECNGHPLLANDALFFMPG